MKKKWIFTIILSFSFASTFACDICGCGVGSYYLGILPQFNKRFIGLRYQYKTLTTHISPDGQTSYLTSDEKYQTAELWGGFNFGSKFRLLYFIPYNFNERQSIELSGSKNGLGDVAFMGYYNLLDKKQTLGSSLLVQSLWVGAGIKLPTGKYEPLEKDLVDESPNNFQLGTGSTDFTLNAAYDIRLMDFGVDVNLNYKINTNNRYDYRYGNKFTTNALAYYKFRVAKTLTIAPNAGVLYETSAQDTEEKIYKIDVSGGYSLSLIGGLEASFNRFSVGGNYQNVASQNLAGGSVKAGDRFLIHASVAF
ncbi:transporter [Pedobacter sp. HMF7647]|uniref:Transporter n=2 Tax=Hufsiella arboris TaxID=2695275 RepID=A0A7K1Y5A0_9SPHI|nr:transporter [Hufsiella arboris]MXV49762.1 transporter [Hufsiella arboris]